ncbi:sugar nucleotide-binding protein [Patescibacteria group bacterium]|nr:sugar nucleotide-binding protein [Patescibacteria group bacterium]MBU1934913.1 sugar nucleotide-binding protein [Patescibacteria group bacterium]
MKILLFGGTGFIGSQLKEALYAKGHDVHSPRIEIRNFDEVKKTIEEIEPDYIINATGKTGTPNVDWCETHPVETFGVNVGGSLNIAAAAFEKGVKVAQISSGCVYSGNNGGKGFSEEDEPNFFGSLYSRSRVISEKLLKEFPNVLQLRIRIPIMGKSHPKNLIDKLLQYPQMINVTNSCTVMEDFIPAAIELIERGETGIFNMTNIGAMNHVEIMTPYKEIVDPDFEINLMSQEDQDELNKRRSNDVLNTDKRENLGVHMPPLEESVRRVMENYKQNS